MATDTFRGHVYDDITQSIGNTPLIRLRRIVGDAQATVVGKLENFNPLWSVKDRIGVAMIDAAEKAGKIKADTLIVEPTSGNTGIGLAFTCAARGYKLTVTMPESMSLERQRLLKALRGETGADAARTRHERRDRRGDEDAARHAAANRRRSCRSNSRTRPTRRFTARPPRRKSGGRPTGEIDILVSGVGTGGTITGCGEVLKSRKPSVKCIAVEPVNSPVLTQHLVQGIAKDAVKPRSAQDPGDRGRFHPGRAEHGGHRRGRSGDRRRGVRDGPPAGEGRGDAVRHLERRRGSAAVKIAQRPENAGKVIVVVLPDLGERYLSTALYPPE